MNLSERKGTNQNLNGAILIENTNIHSIKKFGQKNISNPDNKRQSVFRTIFHRKQIFVFNNLILYQGSEMNGHKDTTSYEEQ